MGFQMRVLFTVAMTCAVLIGCNQSKSPDVVANNVAAAEQKTDADVAKATDSASKDVGNAASKVGDKITDLNNTAATDAYKIMIAKLDGDHKVALAQCDALAGDPQKSCRTQADADYEAAKTNAKADEAANKQ